MVQGSRDRTSHTTAAIPSRGLFDLEDLEDPVETMV